MKFFYLWFKAVNDKYFQACANFDKIRNDFLKRNNEGIPFSPSKNIPNEILDNLEHAKNDEILAISLITALSFEIGFMKEHREYTLSALFSDKIVQERRESNWLYSIIGFTPPAILLNDNKSSNEIDNVVPSLLNKLNFLDNTLEDQHKNIQINLNYPINRILRDI